MQKQSTQYKMTWSKFLQHIIITYIVIKSYSLYHTIEIETDMKYINTQYNIIQNRHTVETFRYFGRESDVVNTDFR